MKGVREIKRRLKSVGNIKKITKAMEMVAATKLRRLQERALKTRPFARKIEELIGRVSMHVDEGVSPLLAEHDQVEREAVIIVGADRGLCGSYNANLFREGSRHLKALQEENVRPELYLFGKRPAAFFKRFPSAEIAWEHEGQVEAVNYQEVKALVTVLSEAFIEGRIQRVRIVHTELRSLASFVATTVDLLPLPRIVGEDGEEVLDYILEPSPEVIMRELLPRYLEMQLYAALLEALASEFASRRMAMKSATDNAQEMIGDLQREYNKARQEGITGELLDIIGGMAAVS